MSEYFHSPLISKLSLYNTIDVIGSGYRVDCLLFIIIVQSALAITDG